MYNNRMRPDFEETPPVFSWQNQADGNNNNNGNDQAGGHQVAGGFQQQHMNNNSANSLDGQNSAGMQTGGATGSAGFNNQNSYSADLHIEND